MSDVPVFYHRWRQDEIEQLMGAVMRYGKKWDKIRDLMFPRLKARSLKNKYAQLMRCECEMRKYAQSAGENLATELSTLINRANKQMQHEFHSFERSFHGLVFQPLSMTDRASLESADLELPGDYETQRGFDDYE